MSDIFIGIAILGGIAVLVGLALRRRQQETQHLMEAAEAGDWKPVIGALVTFVGVILVTAFAEETTEGAYTVVITVAVFASFMIFFIFLAQLRRRRDNRVALAMVLATGIAGVAGLVALATIHGAITIIIYGVIFLLAGGITLLVQKRRGRQGQPSDNSNGDH